MAWAGEARTLDAATNLAGAMAAGVPDGWVVPLTGGRLAAFAPPVVALVLAHLAPRRVRVDLLSPLCAPVAEGAPGPGLAGLPGAPAPVRATEAWFGTA